MKFLYKIVPIVIACLLLAGCWDRREIEERTSVFAIGIDRTEQNPELLEISVQIPIPIRIAGSSGSGGSGDSKETVMVESATGRTVLEASQNLQKKVNQQLFYGHTRVIAISEEAARLGVSKLFDPFRRDPQMRRLLWPIVIKGRAVDILRISPNLEQIPTVYVMTMIENGVKTGTTTNMNLGLFFIQLSSHIRQPYLNYFTVQDNKLRWAGLALFREDRLVGTLSDRETWKFLRIAETKRGENITFNYRNDPAKLLTISTEFISRKEHISYKDGKVNINIKIRMEGNLLEKTFETQKFTQKEIAQIEQDAASFLKKETNAVIQKLQHTYKTDVLGIGSRIEAYHPSIWRKLDWEHDFQRADITTLFDIKLRNTGMELD